MEEERNLPDEELHDLYHQLAIKWEELCVIHTKIYAYIELMITHKEAVKKMIEDKDV